MLFQTYAPVQDHILFRPVREVVGDRMAITPQSLACKLDRCLACIPDLPPLQPLIVQTYGYMSMQDGRCCFSHQNPVQEHLVWMRLFYLQLRSFYLRFVLFTCSGETVKKTKPYFRTGGNRKSKRANRISTVSNENQTQIQPRRRPNQIQL